MKLRGRHCVTRKEKDARRKRVLLYDFSGGLDGKKDSKKSSDEASIQDEGREGQDEV